MAGELPIIPAHPPCRDIVEVRIQVKDHLEAASKKADEIVEMWKDIGKLSETSVQHGEQIKGIAYTFGGLKISIDTLTSTIQDFKPMFSSYNSVRNTLKNILIIVVASAILGFAGWLITLQGQTQKMQDLPKIQVNRR